MKKFLTIAILGVSLAAPIVVASSASAAYCTQTCSRGFGGSYTCNTWCY
jgi:hypothetical protein